MTEEPKHTPTLPPSLSIEETCNMLEEDYDGQDIVLSHEGCPLLTIRGTNDMSCLEDEEVKQADIDTIAFAEAVADRYNKHEALQSQLKELTEERDHYKKRFHDNCELLTDANKRLMNDIIGLQAKLAASEAMTKKLHELISLMLDEDELSALSEARQYIELKTIMKSEYKFILWALVVILWFFAASLISLLD